MEFTLTQIRQLCAAAKAEGVEVRVSPDGDMVIRPMEFARRPMTATERTRARRARLKEQNETQIVSPEPENETRETDETRNETEIPSPPSPSLPPSSSPTPPPSPTHTPTPEPDPACMREANPNEQEPAPEPEPEEQPRAKAKRPSGKAMLIAEAKATTEKTVLPKDLDTDNFRAAWSEWCQWRIKLAGQGKPWSEFAARNLLRQCADNGEAWAIIEIRQALASGWQGIHWEQHRNPADVRSHPLVPKGTAAANHAPDPNSPNGF